jgi:urea transport system permease protein
VSGAKSWLTVMWPELWLYVLGALFVVVTLFLPKGVIGSIAALRIPLGRFPRRRREAA